MVILDYVLGKQKTVPTNTQNTQNTQTSSSPISAEEDVKIKEWVNKTYSGQSEAYKKAAYKDAYDAVLERKQSNQKKATEEVRRQVNANTASYKGDDKVKQQEAKLAKAEKAIYDAAEIIKEGQRANGVKVNENLTPKQTVDSFLLANNGKPFAEYVSKYLDNNINGRAGTNNLWLASKLGLDTGTTLGIDNRTIVNAGDKLEAGLRGFGQGLVNLTQNTIGAGMNYLGSNIGAGVGEIGYALAEQFGGDTSEGSVWDKLKKAKGYSWSEAKDAANSHLGEKGMILGEITSEDKGAYDIGEGLGETATEIALTAPVGLGAGTAITKSALPKAAKRGLQGLNALGEGIAFQGLEDATNGELSSAGKYAQTGLLSAATGGVTNAAGKVIKTLGKVPRQVFGASDRAENALLKKSVQEWDKMSEISKGYAKDANAVATPYTEMRKKLSKAYKTIEDDQISKGKELQKVRQNLKYIEGQEYTRENVKDDINKALRNLSSKRKYGDAAKELDQIPQFEIKDGKLALSESSKAELDLFKGTNEKNKDLSLGDEIIKLYDRVYSMGAKDNAANTHLFIQELKSLYNQGWSGGNPNILRETINSLKGIDNSFKKSLYATSRDELSKASKLDKAAIDRKNNFNKLIGAMGNGKIDDVKAALKALKGNQTTEEFFKDIRKATGGEVDMNNEVLSWAYNLSLYDVTKANELLSTFYPSKAGAIETVIKGLSKPLRQYYAREQVKSGIKTADIPTSTDRLNIAFEEIANIINTNDNE